MVSGVADEEEELCRVGKSVGWQSFEGRCDLHAHAHGPHAAWRSVMRMATLAAALLLQSGRLDKRLTGEPQAGEVASVESGGDFFAVDPRGAEFFKGFPSMADGDAGTLQNLQARIQTSAPLQRAQVRRRNPARGGAFHRNNYGANAIYDVQVAGDVILSVEELGQFADGQA